MITTTELRIGNHFKYGEKTFTVLGINNNVVLANSNRGKIDFGIESIEAVILTEEYLFRFGFEKVRYEKYAHTKLNKLRAYPHVMKKGFGIYLMGAYTLPHIKYVHQLQNLYFSLTGEELKIQP